jgi:hypothetical protein
LFNQSEEKLKKDQTNQKKCSKMVYQKKRNNILPYQRSPKALKPSSANRSDSFCMAISAIVFTFWTVLELYWH